MGGWGGGTRLYNGTHWVAGWADITTGLDDMEKRKFLTLPGLNSNP
jgi:hypothetical protein